ncbi:PEP-dependent dihydroxyacetone kinase, ADP-binding subunit DhaL [Nocardioides aquaticus]|uniref:PEP-dependent dihydroxyacetone kinase, ADP-binding subunit DhaL n=1 Tax=Nocardioides aquaticus TaxID=160826 RepID=A0ABX8ELY3_9ACTN|nr:dihydroxyacetone kinase subunit DhaL [Nocardioides aquaticus]QVT81289.1 PEP-dependent dihydroxyacetone kinase, ADP-binding subunit DhaL [Nocardioides aquaticus]
MADSLTHEQLVAWLAAFRDSVHEHRDHLTELDAAIGDADHGTNLTRGMDAVMAVVAADDAPDTAAGLLKAVGMKLVSTVGGASGPLYGTFFLRAAGAAGDASTLDAGAVLGMLRAGVEGLAARGKAELGDKTMVDALAPAVEALADAVANGADLATGLRAAAEAAATGREATTGLEARKGRASYLGERSKGHTDPGAASATMLVEALADAVG